MKIVYSCANKYIRWTMGTYFFIRPQGYNLWDFCLVCGCNSSVQSSAWHRVSKIDIYWQKEWIHFGNSSVPPYSKPVTVCKMNACGHCTLEVWSSLWSHTRIQIPAWTLQLCDLVWVSWVLIVSLSSCPLGVVLVNLFLAGLRKVKSSKEQSVLTVMPEYENHWPCLKLFSPFHNFQFICMNSHL